jgi:uncharacterized membrane protein
MEAAADTTVLTILGTAFGVMFAAVITLMFASMRVQHRDSIAIRSLITESGKENRQLIENAKKENRQLIEDAKKENRQLIDRLSADFEEHKRVTERIVISLADARERLARIEGHLGVRDNRADDSSDSRSKTGNEDTGSEAA